MDRVAKAEELFKSGYNCAQSVIGAFCDDFNLDFDTTMKLSEGIGGGIGRMRLTCGAVSGMVMVAGMMLSRGENDGDTRKEVYGKVQELAAKFKEMNGSIVCAELLGENVNTKPEPDKRNEKYYRKRPCADLVKDCVRILEEEFRI